MAIHKGIVKQFRKYFTSNESILATIYGRTILGDENDRYCVTEKQIGILHKEKLFDWKYSKRILDTIESITLDEGVMKASIIINTVNKRNIRFDNIDRKDARDFIDEIKKLKKNEVVAVDKESHYA